MEQRIFGVKSEYSPIFSSVEGRRGDLAQSAQGYLLADGGGRPLRPNEFLLNGSRLSRAPRGHLAYATPECDNPRDLVIHDKAGERIVEGLVIEAEQALRDNGVACEVLLAKTDCDPGGIYRCHENYLVERAVSLRKLADQLIPFLVTRQVFAGAGKVLKTRMGNQYYVSQRAQHIYQEISSDPRSIINSRDEPHADELKYRRLQVMVGDSNMSEFATYLKIGTTAIVLCMIEDGFIKRDLALEDPVRAIKEVSHDTACKRQVKVKWSEKTYSAIEIQREYLDLAVEYYRSRDRTPQVADLLEKWQSVLDKLAEDPMSLHRELDWVIKRKRIAQDNCSFDDPRSTILDLHYHDIKRTRGLYHLMVQDGLIDRLVTDWEIERAMGTPPQTTRAKVRSDFIGRAKERKKSYDVGWSYLKLNDRYQRVILLKDPFKSWDPRVEALFL